MHSTQSHSTATMQIISDSDSMQTASSAAAAAALPAAQLPPQLQSSPAQRCHPDPLSIALSFLDSTDFANAARACRQWAVASCRKTAWPQPSVAQLADFSVEPGRLLRQGFIRGSLQSPLIRTLDNVMRSGARSSITALSLRQAFMSHKKAATLLQHASQLPALHFLSLSCHPTILALLNDEAKRCGSLQALRIDFIFSPDFLPFIRLQSNLRALSIDVYSHREVFEAPLASLTQLEYLTLNFMGAIWVTDSSRHLIEQLLSHPSLTSVHFDHGWTPHVWLHLLTQITDDGSVAFSHLQQLRFRSLVSTPLSSIQPLVQLFPHLHSLDLRILVDVAALPHMIGALTQLRCLVVAVDDAIDLAAVAAFSAHPSLELVQLRSSAASQSMATFDLSVSVLHALATSRSWRTLAFVGAWPLQLQRQLEELPRRTDISPELKASLQQSLFRFEIWDERELNCTVLLLWPRKEF